MEQVYLGFTLDSKTFGIAAQDVLRVSQIVEITPIPQAPETVMGIINVMGEVVPVIDLRKLLHLPSRSPALSDYIIIVKKGEQTISFVVDKISGLIPSYAENDVSLKNIIQNSPIIERVIKLNDTFILIVNTQKLLSEQASRQVQQMVETQHETTIFTTVRKATA